MFEALQSLRISQPYPKREAFSWKSILRQGFSHKELSNASVGTMGSLKDYLVISKQFGFLRRQRDLMSIEVYQGQHGVSARVYFQPKEGFVPTYVICTSESLEELRKREAKLQIDPVVENNIARGDYGTVDLNRLAKKRRLRGAMQQLLAQENLVFAQRMTTHVYTGRDRHIMLDGEKATVRVFTDRVHPQSGKYTALVFKETGQPLLETSPYGPVGALNVTNDEAVMQYRPKMQWRRVS